MELNVPVFGQDPVQERAVVVAERDAGPAGDDSGRHRRPDERGHRLRERGDMRGVDRGHVMQHDAERLGDIQRGAFSFMARRESAAPTGERVSPSDFPWVSGTARRTVVLRHSSAQDRNSAAAAVGVHSPDGGRSQGGKLEPRARRRDSHCSNPMCNGHWGQGGPRPLPPERFCEEPWDTTDIRFVEPALRTPPNHTARWQSPRIGEGASGTLSAPGYVLLQTVPDETGSSGGRGCDPLALPHQGAPGPGGGTTTPDAVCCSSTACRRCAGPATTRIRFFAISRPRTHRQPGGSVAGRIRQHGPPRTGSPQRLPALAGLHRLHQPGAAGCGHRGRLAPRSGTPSDSGKGRSVWSWWSRGWDTC